MALPAHLLEQLPPHVRRGDPTGHSAPHVLSLGSPELDAVLPDGGVPRGSVVELAVSGGSALATTVALGACRAAQQEALESGAEACWCAFVDASASLHGPGVAGLGVELSRLLVVRPPLLALERTAVRLAEARAFSVLVVDTAGVPGATVEVELAAWPRIVRRLSIAAAESGTCVLLVTDAEARRPLPLPVALRVELSRIAAERLGVHVTKDRRGRLGGPRVVSWERGRARALQLREPASVAVRAQVS